MPEAAGPLARRQRLGRFRNVLVLGLVTALLALAPAVQATASQPGNAYHQTNLVSDLPGMAQLTDPDLVNPWGMAAGPATPAWVADNGTGKATLYRGFVNGSPIQKVPLVVSIPRGAPTGQVFNPAPGFVVRSGDASGPALFLFDSEVGLVTGWNPGVPPPPPSTQAQVGASVPDADRKDEVDGPALGFVDVYSTSGHLLRHLIERGQLNAPWGLVRAPAGFGRFSGALLVGNFGNGRINAYNPDTGEFLGRLRHEDGSPIQIDGLWALRFGNGVIGTPTTLLFTAGIDDEAHGLFGAIQAAG